jgi:hypothetical protein
LRQATTGFDVLSGLDHFLGGIVPLALLLERFVFGTVVSLV